MAEKCCVRGCNRIADYKVALYDIYAECATYEDPVDRAGTVFMKQDSTCPFICAVHLAENEEKAQGIRGPRRLMAYPYTNQHGAPGFTIYVPLGVDLAR